MTYAELIVFRGHLDSFLRIMSATPDPSKPETLTSAISLWRAVQPESPILQILDVEDE